MIDTQNKIIIAENGQLRLHPELVQDGYVIRECNLVEEFPHTMKFAGRTGLKIIECPIKNCDFPDGTIFENCAYQGIHEAPEPEQPIIELTVKEQAKEILQQIKPLAYQDPDAVREAVVETFTETERQGVGVEVVNG